MAPTAHVKVNVGGAATVLQKLAGAAKDFRTVFRARIDPILTRFFGRQFETKGAEGGTPWAPLAESTIRGRTRQLAATRTKGVHTTSKVGRARAGFAAPLRDTLRLWASLAKHTGPEVIKVFEPLMYRRGTSVPYADHAQRAGPGRPLIPHSMPASYVAEMEAALLAHLEQAA